MDRRQYLRWAAAAATGGLAGCSGDGGGDGGDGDTTPTETDEPTPTATGEPTATPSASMGTDTTTATASATSTDTASPTATATPRPEVAAEVTVAPNGDFRFAPSEVTVSVGDTVRWIWEGLGHNVKPTDVPSGSDWSGTPGDDSKTYGEGYVYTHSFEVAGSFEYVCVPHRSLGMTGTVVVEA